MDALSMEKLLAEKGTPAKYREKYLKLGRELLGWRFQEATGAYRMGPCMLLHEGMALRWLRNSDGINTVLRALFDSGYRLQCDCWGASDSFVFQARLIRGKMPLFRGVYKGELAATIQDAILSAAYETLPRFLIPPEGF